MQNDWIVVGWYPKGSLDVRQLSAAFWHLRQVAR